MTYRQNRGGIFNLPVSDFLTPRSKLKPLKYNAKVSDVFANFIKGDPIVIVIDEKNSVVGIVTPKLVREKLDPTNFDPNDSIDIVMNKQVVVVYDDESVESAALTMKKMGFELGIPVISSKTDEYIGFLFRSDISRQVDTFIKGVRSGF